MTIRFSGKDAQLQAWLAQFSTTNDMSKVVKLACYLLSGLEPDEGLLALLHKVEGLRKSGTESPKKRQPRREPTPDALAAVLRELNALRAELAATRVGGAFASAHDYAKEAPGTEAPAWTQRRAARPPATLPEFAAPLDPAPTASSGLDLSPRRKRPAAAAPASGRPPADFDPREMLRILTQTTRQFGQEYQGH